MSLRQWSQGEALLLVQPAVKDLARHAPNHIHPPKNLNGTSAIFTFHRSTELVRVQYANFAYQKVLQENQMIWSIKPEG